MTTFYQNNSTLSLMLSKTGSRPAPGFGQSKARRNSIVILLFASATVFAQNNGITHLPENYRTPLSDMTYDDNPQWRLPPEDENPWRADQEDELIKPRIKAEFFPRYNYETVEDPNPGPLFQNEYELDKPVSNIFKYTF